jgi:hypothetical protein
VIKICVSRRESQQEEKALTFLILSLEAECISSEVCSEVAIQSEASATQSKEADETDYENEEERGQRS